MGATSDEIKKSLISGSLRFAGAITSHGTVENDMSKLSLIIGKHQCSDKKESKGRSDQLVSLDATCSIGDERHNFPGRMICISN